MASINRHRLLREQVLHMYETEEAPTPTGIAQRLELTRSTVTRWLHDAGLRTVKPQVRLKQQRTQALKLYREALRRTKGRVSLSHIARKLEVSPRTVVRWLNDAGLWVRRVNVLLSKDPDGYLEQALQGSTFEDVDPVRTRALAISRGDRE